MEKTFDLERLVKEARERLHRSIGQKFRWAKRDCSERFRLAFGKVQGNALRRLQGNRQHAVYHTPGAKAK